jgi:inner membrane protein
MDSLTQATLGAAVGVLVMGRHQPVWKAAAWGGLCGTLPDLDAFIQHGDPVLNMVRHRAETHAFALQTIAAPVIALVIALVTRSLGQWPRWLLMVWLALVTHAALDAMTVYGTRLLLPFDDTPLGLASMFIIDPLYTVPLIVGLVFAIRKGGPGLRYNTIALVLSTAYLGWSWYAQQEVRAVVERQLASEQIPAENILVTPTAFNTLLWRVLVMRENHYQEGFYAILDRWQKPRAEVQFSSFKRDAVLDRATRNLAIPNEIRNFSRGFYRVASDNGSVTITDLRMGQEPFYVFSFEFAKQDATGVTPVPTRNAGNRSDLPLSDAFAWLWRSMWGSPQLPPR